MTTEPGTYQIHFPHQIRICHHHEPPGLEIAGGRCRISRLHQLFQRLPVHRTIREFPDAPALRQGLHCFHHTRLPFISPMISFTANLSAKTGWEW